MTKVNVGCGRAPIQGWKNYDNSMSVRLARLPFLFRLLRNLGILSKEQIEFTLFAVASDIEYADVRTRIPEADSSVTAVYASFLLERLTLEEAKLFLAETHRILAPGGIVRLRTVSVRRLVKDYQANGDSDRLLKGLGVTSRRRPSFWARATNLAVGDRGRTCHWMYDDRSLCALLSSAGFISPATVETGKTGITNPGALDLRATELIVEARRP